MSAKVSKSRSFLRFTLERPILTSLALLVIALVFKWVDTFVLRLDERLGEIILCKALGFVLVVLFVWAAGRTLRDVGLHARQLGPSLLIGAGIALLTLLIGYGVEFATQLPAHPRIQLAAIDPKAGVSGGFLFLLWMILGNFVNSFMEEGLFRGVMTRLFRVRFSLWKANGLQAVLFAIWHLPWVLKWMQTGQLEAHGGLLLAALSQFLPMLAVGLFWGYLYLKTNNLWAPWIAHTLNNTVFNTVHVTTVDGLDSGRTVRGLSVMIAALLSMFLVRYLADRFRLPEVKPWGQWDTGLASGDNQAQAS